MDDPFERDLRQRTDVRIGRETRFWLELGDILEALESRLAAGEPFRIEDLPDVDLTIGEALEQVRKRAQERIRLLDVPDGPFRFSGMEED